MKQSPEVEALMRFKAQVREAAGRELRARKAPKPQEAAPPKEAANPEMDALLLEEYGREG